MDSPRPVDNPQAGAAPTIPVAQFLANLQESRLLPEAEVRALAAAGPYADGKQLALDLVKQEKLTPYQASMVYQGKTRGLVLGRYTILEKLGAGGMGLVFKARQQTMGRVVALKVLPPAVSTNPAVVQRFQREVQAAAQLTHPNIVRAFDADHADSVYFLVMECVEGIDLSRLVKARGPLSAAQAAAIVVQAARGLAHAHAAGIIHRDIKPSNLLLESKGTVKILDMGLARFGEEDNTAASSDLTKSGTIMGTADYMAPEQTVNTRKADQRADIYSLGCTLYFLVAGKAPYTGETAMEKFLAHREQAIPPLPNAPAGLHAVFAKMVAKKAAERYQSMPEVSAALENCVGPGSMGISSLVLAARAAATAGPAWNFHETSPDIGNATQVSSRRPARLRWLIAGGILAALVTLGIAAALLPTSKPNGQKAAASKPAGLEQVVSDLVWIEDGTPPGALLTSDGGDDWTWVSSDPPPYSGSKAHQSNIAAGAHQHYFIDGDPLSVASGDKLYVYVYLDPMNLPTCVMVQWHDTTGSWDHRAYWGANDITFGTDGTAGKRLMGRLPAAGRWVRLEVPASIVALEGMNVDGMAFTLFDGRATWDKAGIVFARPRLVPDGLHAR